MRRGTGINLRWLGMRPRNWRNPSRSARGTPSAETGNAMADCDQARSPAASSRRRDALSRLWDNPVSPWSSPRPKRRGRGAGRWPRLARISQAANQTRRSTRRMSFSWYAHQARARRTAGMS